MFWNGKPVQFFQERLRFFIHQVLQQGEMLSGGDGVPREQVLQQSSEFSVEVIMHGNL